MKIIGFKGTGKRAPSIQNQMEDFESDLLRPHFTQQTPLDVDIKEATKEMAIQSYIESDEFFRDNSEEIEKKPSVFQKIKRLFQWG